MDIESMKVIESWGRMTKMMVTGLMMVRKMMTKYLIALPQRNCFFILSTNNYFYFSIMIL